MKDYSVMLTNTNGSAFPNTAAVNASSPSATDGTEYVKVLIDDYWGANQALMRDAGLTPNGSDETATASQRQEAIRFLIQNKAWNAYYNGTNWIYIANGKAFRWTIDDVNERVRFDSAITGTAGGIITWVNGPYIDANGYVGSVEQTTLHVQDQKASTTNGGASSATTWNIRNVNTVITNTITGASIASNQIILPAGTYEVEMEARCVQVNQNKLKLYNVTDAADTVTGMSCFADNTNIGAAPATLSDEFTIAGTKTFEIQHWTQAAVATFGLGTPTSDGSTEIYLNAVFRKIR